jgi:hypothetical protein
VGAVRTGSIADTNLYMATSDLSPPDAPGPLLAERDVLLLTDFVAAVTDSDAFQILSACCVDGFGLFAIARP